MSVSAPDRLASLKAQEALTGIDFVEVVGDGRTLRVHFHRAPIVPSRDEVEIFRQEDDGSRTALALGPDPAIGAGGVLELVTERPGGFGRHRLRIDHPAVDRFFREVDVDFKAFCPRDIDCQPAAHECPTEAADDPVVDYLARDFWSLRRALMEFAAQRYPDWPDRGREADLGVMWAEVLSALGDEFSYYQDRVAREAYLETATQRRSVRRHARLVDYELGDGLVAHGWLDVTVLDGRRGEIPAGFTAYAASDFGPRVDYEVGEGLRDILGKKTYRVDAARNGFKPHIWDEDQTCLPVGSTELFVVGHHAAALTAEASEGGAGRRVLLKTSPTSPAVPARALLVRLVAVEDRDEAGNPLTDPLVLDAATGSPVRLTRLVWDKSEALPFELDLLTLEVRGNIVPMIAGRTMRRRFAIGSLDDATAIPPRERAQVEAAVERTGPNGSPAYLYSLPGTETEALCWNGNDARAGWPEILLLEDRFDSAAGRWQTDAPDFILDRDRNPDEWSWRRSLVGVRSSQPQDRDFTLDDGQWDRLVGYQRNGEEIVHRGYRTGPGSSIRFGDGEFGQVPRRETVFRAVYRVGNGHARNVPEGAVRQFDPDQEVLDSADTQQRAAELVRAVSNPFAVVSGTDGETLAEARRVASEAFRAVAFRAVTAEDYAEAVERLPWVQRAGAAFRWTGSWLTAFATPDPRSSVTLPPVQQEEVRLQLDRFRQAGREAYLRAPKYVDLDLEISVCVEPFSYPAQVKERVMHALVGAGGANGGFFSADNFTFGTPLERSTLERTIQEVRGVRAVEGMTIARKGYFDRRAFDDFVFRVADDEVIRLENDPTHPDRGSLTLVTEGGA